MKQISRILREVNYPLDKIKLVKCVACHNEEDWIELNLSNNYDEYDIIRVVEGAVEGRPGSTTDGHSTDSTVEKIKSFPDPEGKIELYQISRPFKSLEEQKQIFLEMATPGEWLFIVDCDEFYLEGDINHIRKLIHKHPMASEMIPTFLHFYRDIYHVRKPHPEWQPQHQRIIRYRPGMRYFTHPVATLADGKCSYFTPELQPERFTIPIKIYHYGHAKGIEFHRMKAEFYRSELAKFEGRGGSAATEFDLKLDEFANYKEDLGQILAFAGRHPQVIAKNKNLIYYTDDFYKKKNIKSYREDEVYGAEQLPNICVWMMDHWGTKRMEPYYNVA